MNDQQRHYSEFMQATKGYSAWTVAICVNRQTPELIGGNHRVGAWLPEYAELPLSMSFVLHPHMSRLDLK